MLRVVRVSASMLKVTAPKSGFKPAEMYISERMRNNKNSKIMRKIIKMSFSSVCSGFEA
jgi:hypothetical protein